MSALSPLSYAPDGYDDKLTTDEKGRRPTKVDLDTMYVG